MSFNLILKQAGITKSGLAKRLGLTSNSVSKWGDSAPKYAIAYLLLLIEYNRTLPPPKV